MKDFIEYIETSCARLRDNHTTYLYKRKLLDEMTERANEITRAGLKDERVITDLIIDEYSDIEGGYSRFLVELRKKNRAHILKYVLPIGGLIFFILMFVAYFSVSNLTGAWNKTWLIIVGGVFAMLIFYVSFGIRKLCTMSNIFQPFARLLIGGCIVLVSVFVFLFLLMMLPVGTVTWPVIPLGVAAAFVADLIFAYTTRQKFRTISFFVYMPAIAAMIYIALAAQGLITWTGGWPMILLGLVVDLVYILAVLVYNMKYFIYRQEDEE